MKNEKILQLFTKFLTKKLKFLKKITKIKFLATKSSILDEKFFFTAKRKKQQQRHHSHMITLTRGNLHASWRYDRRIGPVLRPDYPDQRPLLGRTTASCNMGLPISWPSWVPSFPSYLENLCFIGVFAHPRQPWLGNL